MKPDPLLPRIFVSVDRVPGMGLVAYDAESGRILGLQQGLTATVASYEEQLDTLTLQMASIDVIVDDRVQAHQIAAELGVKPVGLEDSDLESCPDCGSAAQKENRLTEQDPNLRICANCGKMYFPEIKP